MNAFSLFIRLFIASIFIGSFYSKVIDFNRHLDSVKEYKILQKDIFIRIFVYLTIILELFISINLFIGFQQKLDAIFSVGLLGIYTLAIVINLMKGRNNISCGCGGVMGDHNLSWILFFRNLVLIIFSFLLFYFPSNWLLLMYIFRSNTSSSPFISYEIILFTIGILIAYSSLNNLIDISKIANFMRRRV